MKKEKFIGTERITQINLRSHIKLEYKKRLCMSNYFF